VELFRDRIDAGRILARKLFKYKQHPDVLVLGLPRGGIPVAFEVAQELNAPLDVFLVRKLGLPGHEELAMGAIASGGVRVLNADVVNLFRVPLDVIDHVADKEEAEMNRREQVYRQGRPPPQIRSRAVIVVDDGLATGSTMRAAVGALRRKDPSRIVVAVPVAAPSTCEELRGEVDEMICAETPEPFHAVGLWYEDFTQTTDAEIRGLLDRAAQLHPAA
jgi:putative phosphoribosyl transferase